MNKASGERNYGSVMSNLVSFDKIGHSFAIRQERNLIKSFGDEYN